MVKYRKLFDYKKAATIFDVGIIEKPVSYNMLHVSQISWNIDFATLFSADTPESLFWFGHEKSDLILLNMQIRDFVWTFLNQRFMILDF